MREDVYQALPPPPRAPVSSSSVHTQRASYIMNELGDLSQIWTKVSSIVVL